MKNSPHRFKKRVHLGPKHRMTPSLERFQLKSMGIKHKLFQNQTTRQNQQKWSSTWPVSRSRQWAFLLLSTALLFILVEEL